MRESDDRQTIWIESIRDLLESSTQSIEEQAQSVKRAIGMAPSDVQRPILIEAASLIAMQNEPDKEDLTSPKLFERIIEACIDCPIRPYSVILFPPEAIRTVKRNIIIAGLDLEPAYLRPAIAYLTDLPDAMRVEILGRITPEQRALIFPETELSQEQDDPVALTETFDAERIRGRQALGTFSARISSEAPRRNNRMMG